MLYPAELRGHGSTFKRRRRFGQAAKPLAGSPFLPWPRPSSYARSRRKCRLLAGDGHHRNGGKVCLSRHRDARPSPMPSRALHRARERLGRCAGKRGKTTSRPRAPASIRGRKPSATRFRLASSLREAEAPAGSDLRLTGQGRAVVTPSSGGEPLFAGGGADGLDDPPS